MAHVRTQIRQLFKQVLDANLSSSEYKIYSSRKSPRNHTPTKAIVDMRFSNDQARMAETMSDDRIHVASLMIRVQRSADETLLDDLLDVDEIRIINAIETQDWTNYLEETPDLMQVNFSDDSRGGNILGAIVLRFDLIYRIDKYDPETIIA